MYESSASFHPHFRCLFQVVIFLSILRIRLLKCHVAVLMKDNEHSVLEVAVRFVVGMSHAL